MLTRLGYFVTESSEHFAEYTPWFIKEGREDLIEKFGIPLDEYPKRCVEQIARWKQESAELTGSDTIAARFLYAEAFEFRPVMKIWLACNHKPEITGTDEGIWRRLRLIPFGVEIPPERRDPELQSKLRAEASGILAWAVRGARVRSTAVPR